MACEQWHAPLKLQLVLVLLLMLVLSRVTSKNLNEIKKNTETQKNWFNPQLIYNIYNYRFCHNYQTKNYVLTLMSIDFMNDICFHFLCFFESLYFCSLSRFCSTSHAHTYRQIKSHVFKFTKEKTLHVFIHVYRFHLDMI